VSTTFERPLGAAPASAAGVRARERAWGDSRYQAFALMRLGYTVLPIAMGIDKFFNAMVSWPQYLAGWINDIAPGTAQQFMYFVGAVEILAGLIVLLKPRCGAYVVAAWLAGIVINLFSTGNWWDIGVRDFGLMLGALALGRLAAYYDAPFFSRSRS
jgi:DoxX-like protein